MDGSSPRSSSAATARSVPWLGFSSNEVPPAGRTAMIDAASAEAAFTIAVFADSTDAAAAVDASTAVGPAIGDNGGEGRTAVVVAAVAAATCVGEVETLVPEEEEDVEADPVLAADPCSDRAAPDKTVYPLEAARALESMRAPDCGSIDFLKRSAHELPEAEAAPHAGAGAGIAGAAGAAVTLVPAASSALALSGDALGAGAAAGAWVAGAWVVGAEGGTQACVVEGSDAPGAGAADGAGASPSPGQCATSGAGVGCIEGLVEPTQALKARPDADPAERAEGAAPGGPLTSDVELPPLQLEGAGASVAATLPAGRRVAPPWTL